VVKGVRTRRGTGAEQTEEATRKVSRFSGRVRLGVDSKGRTSVPARFRDPLAVEAPGEPQYRAMLVPWFGECLRVYSLDAWAEAMEALDQSLLERAMLEGEEDESLEVWRLVCGQAVELELDGHGRFVIPRRMREDFGIDASIDFVGMSGFLEIWDSDRLDASLLQAQRKLDRRVVSRMLNPALSQRRAEGAV
jgi:MraZ protein